MSEIVKMIQDIKDFDELQSYANAQYNTLIAQSKKIHKLQEEIEKLTVQVEQAKQQSVVSNALDTSKDLTSDAETICLIQLALLNGKSMNGELTLEETKKVETFSKVLLSLNVKADNGDKEKEELGKFDTKDLLNFVNKNKAEA